MIVRELIEKLKGCDQFALVVFFDKMEDADFSVEVGDVSYEAIRVDDGDEDNEYPGYVTIEADRRINIMEPHATS